MKRFHVHVNVEQLGQSISFYSMLFGAGPNVVKPDYAKWMLDDPRINFAISQRDRPPGVDHLGMQAENDDELAALGERLQAAGAMALAEKATQCCYARSDKFWAEDPQGVRWESFHTHGDATTYTGSTEPVRENSDAVCCGPAPATRGPQVCGANAASGCC